MNPIDPDDDDCQEQPMTPELLLMKQQHELFLLKSPAYALAHVLDAKNEVDPTKYAPHDLVFCIDDNATGRISPKMPVVDEDGCVTVLFPDLSSGKYSIGLNGIRPEVQLLGKNDGTNVTILHDGQEYEVNGVFGTKFEPGQTIKVNDRTKQIVSTEVVIDGPGEIGIVKRVLDENYSEIEFHGQARVVFNGKAKGKIALHDRVQVNHSGYVVVRALGRENEDDYTVETESLNVEWDDIGGCEEAKLSLKQALEYPMQYPELFKFYGRKAPKGILLYGPTGCGKTLLVKASALSVAKAHGKKAAKTGLTMVKGPEVLSKWVGTAEERVRSLFKRGRDHFREHGYPPLLVIDEAESLVMVRGSGRSSDVEKTIVPTFLAEMDGVEPYPGIVILLTNRPDMLDPAIVRVGRIDRHIKVPRPDDKTAKDIFRLHLNGTPLYNTTPEEVVEEVVSEAYSATKPLYRIRSRQLTDPLQFTLKDCVNGAMLAGIVDIAVDIAMERDRLSKKSPKGVAKADFVAAVDKQYREQIDQNHQFDLDSFFEDHGLQACNVTVEKLRVT